MSYSRDGVLVGQDVILRAVFVDDFGNLVAPDAIPEVYIYSTAISYSTVYNEAEAAVYTSAIAGPLVPTEVTPGLYELTYSVPADWSQGPGHDLWVADFSGNSDYTILSFTVDPDIAALGGQLQENEVLTLWLSRNIQNVDGDQTLGTDITFAWLTELNPFCVSVELVRMTLGPWIQWIPDSTLAMMIHWSSVLAKHAVPPIVCNADWLRYAKAQFIIYDIAIKAYYMPDAPGAYATGSGDTKRLGDFSIKKGGSGNASGNVLSSGVDLQTVKQMEKQRADWFKVLNSGACLMVGQSLPSGFAIPGWNSPGRYIPGRLPEDPSSYPFAIPTQNEKYLPPGHYRTKNRYQQRSPSSGALNGKWWRW